MVLGGWDVGCPMCDGLSWTRESALSGCHTVIGEGHREVRGERAAGNERDALGRVSSPSLQVLEPGLQKAPPSLHPGCGCMRGLGEPLFRPEPGVQTWLGPSSRCPPSGLLASEAGLAGCGSGFAGISGKLFPSLGRVFASVKWANTHPGGPV